MKNLSGIRNIGIVAHIDSGKTTLTERILYYTGVNHRVGEVHDGNATMDHMKQEREHGITISSAATRCKWRQTEISIIDTPGHIDFTVEVSRSLRVLDGLIFLFSAVDGVEPQSETNWRLANEYQVSRITFVNKMDRTGADFSRVVEDIRDKLGGQAIPIQIPIGAEERFEGVIDLVSMKAVYQHGSMGEVIGEKVIPSALIDEALESRRRMIEALCEVDMRVLECYLEKQELSPDLLLSALRRACLSNQIVPVLCGSAFKNKGIQTLLDAVVSLLPSPADKGNDATSPFVGLIFKVVADKHGQDGMPG